MTTRSRNVTSPAGDCPPLTDTTTCSPQLCARDCALSAWSAWSACSVSCGGGRRERTRTVTQAAVAPGKECPIDRSESEECGMEMCTAAGLSCSEYTLCTDCTDNGKTSPRRCQFCAKSGGVGVCQSLFVNDVDASGGLRACPIDFDARATTIAACSPGGAPASTATDGATTTTAAQVIETVDIRTVLKLGVNETTAQADVTLSGGIRLQVRVVGEQGAMLRALDNGIGVFSPSRDGTNSSNATSSAPAYGHVRAGLSVEFLFAKDRPVSFRRLSLGAWDDGDSAQVTISNDAFAAERRRDDTSVIVLVNQAEWTFDEKDTSAGFTKYALSAVGESDFTIKSFEFATAARAPSDAPRGTDDANAITEMQSGFQFDTITIALIAAGGAVCLLLVVGLIVCAVRRRKSKASSELSSDSTTKSLDDMRPALGTAEFTLASSNEYARPPVQQQPNTGDDFYNVLPVSQQHHQPPTNYKDLHVSPARASSYQDLRMPPPPSESDGVYQALPATPAISTYTPSLFGTMQSLSQGESDQGMYVNMPVAARYDAVGGNENFVQAIAGANNGAMPPPPLSPRGMYASSGLR
jgi:hypothetical protein